MAKHNIDQSFAFMINVPEFSTSFLYSFGMKNENVHFDEILPILGKLFPTTGSDIPGTVH